MVGNGSISEEKIDKIRNYIDRSLRDRYVSSEITSDQKEHIVSSLSASIGSFLEHGDGSKYKIIFDDL